MDNKLYLGIVIGFLIGILLGTYFGDCPIDVNKALPIDTVELDIKYRR